MGETFSFGCERKRGPPGSLWNQPGAASRAPWKLWSNLENPTHSHAWYVDYSPRSQCLSGNFWLQINHHGNTESTETDRNCGWGFVLHPPSIKFTGLISTRRTSKSEEVLDDLTTFRMVIVEEFRMKLDPKKPAPSMLHSLNLAGFVGSSCAEASRQLLHFVAV
jgi:hypothetical protein